MKLPDGRAKDMRNARAISFGQLLDLTGLVLGAAESNNLVTRLHARPA